MAVPRKAVPPPDLDQPSIRVVIPSTSSCSSTLKDTPEIRVSPIQAQSPTVENEEESRVHDGVQDIESFMVNAAHRVNADSFHFEYENPQTPRTPKPRPDTPDPRQPHAKLPQLTKYSLKYTVEPIAPKPSDIPQYVYWLQIPNSESLAKAMKSAHPKHKFEWGFFERIDYTSAISFPIRKLLSRVKLCKGPTAKYCPCERGWWIPQSYGWRCKQGVHFMDHHGRKYKFNWGMMRHKFLFEDGMWYWEKEEWLTNE